MSTSETIIKQIERDCDLPDSWNAIRTAGSPSTIEVSGYDGEEMQEEIVELINGDLLKEVVIGHSNMPGRASAHQMDELEEPALPIPEQVGVLQFEELDHAIAAIDELADPTVLAEITAYRSPIKTDEPLSVSEAVAKVTDIDMGTVEGTLTAI